MKATDSIEISAGKTVPSGTAPVVIIGANGTGKSMLGIQLNNHGAQRISARRALDIAGIIPLQPLAQATREREQLARQFSSQRTGMTNDLHAILTELNAQEMELGRQLRDDVVSNLSFQLNRNDLVSRLDQVKRIWESLFPERKLSFKGSEPKVDAKHRANSPTYSQNEMSDGERQALYLTSKVASIPDGYIIVVDEPEIHLHPMLARRLWDLLQDFRPQSRFVYITHDLLFALSRRAGATVICRADGAHEIVTTIPDDVTTEILGAASMPLMVNRVFFCEGKPHSLDMGLFDVWFSSSDVAVYPVESCDNVVKAVDGFRAFPTNRAAVFGIVDRDVRCQGELTFLASKNIHVLPVAEVEHLYCIPDVIHAVLNHLGKTSTADHQLVLTSLQQSMKQHHSPGAHRLALERSQDRIRWELKFPLSTVPAGPSTAIAAANLATAYSQAISNVNPTAIYSEAEKVVNGALAGSFMDMLKDLPGKVVLTMTAQAVGLKNAEAYTTLVRAGIRGDMDENLQKALVVALSPHLPNR